MFESTVDETQFIGFFIEGFFYGIYSGIFAVYLQCQTPKKGNKTRNTIFYLICVLYVLSTSLLACDIVSLSTHYQSPRKPLHSTLTIYLIQTTSFGCCDFIAQCILIYRCWIVWGRNIHVAIIPSLLAFAYLGTWLASGDSIHIKSDQVLGPGWELSLLFTSLVISLTVNALVTGLIVFKVLEVFREVKAASETGGNKLWRVIFILIESGMALFAIQLARLVVTIVWTARALNIFIGIHQMLNGITPTIILVRTSMGLSFDDEKSMEEVAIESMRYEPNHPSSVSETGSIDIEHSRDDDIGIQRSDDIEK